MRIPLNLTRTGLFVANSGTPGDTSCSIELSPSIYGVTWVVQSYRIRTNSIQTFGPSKFWIYRDFRADTNELDSTFDGDGSTDPSANYEVVGQGKLIAYWTGAPVGTQASITLRGDVQTGRG